ncbi:MAG TPA: thioredoxin domain-containing protein [Gemmatimonadales bacterium]|nr:thioredoxin domain-containing protein [Gemmatimonadales bacterium]
MIRRALAGVALLALCGASPAPPGQSDPLAVRSKGRADAPITMYEMSDFQCPYCRQFTLETMPSLERDYIATGKVRVVYINFPLGNVHKNARVAAEFAMCAAQQQRFWPVHDLLFRHQHDWAGLDDPRGYLLGLGDSAGLDRSRLSHCVTSGATAAEVQADLERAQRAGAASTPSFYIEGGLLEGAAPITVFRAVLDSIYQSKTRSSAPPSPSPSPSPR